MKKQGKKRKLCELMPWLVILTLSLGVLWLPAAMAQDCDYCFNDGFGYSWCLNVIDSTPTAVFFSGYVNVGGDVRTAVATWLKGNKGMSMSGAEGTGVAFNYNLVASGGLRGCWINVSPSAGHGAVTVTNVPCSLVPEYVPEVEGPIPGVVEP